MLDIVADFNACCDGSLDMTDAWNAMLALAKTLSIRSLYIPAGEYRFDRKPNPIDYAGVELHGDGLLTRLIRNYQEDYGRGLIEAVPGMLSTTVRRMLIKATAESGGGSAIAFNADAINASTMCVLEDLYVTADGYNRWDNAIWISGAAKQPPGAIGQRIHSWRNVHAFGSRWGVRLESMVGFSWIGGGIYPGGAGDNGGLIITGTPASLSGNVLVNCGSISGLNMAYATGIRIDLVSLGTLPNGYSVENDTTVSNVRVRLVAAPGGPVRQAWVNSSVAT